MSHSIYFPFPEKRISYDCHACGYQCCRGLGVGIKGSELEALLSLRPELRPFTRASSLARSSAFELATFSPTCFMLQQNGDCEIEAKLGRSKKPWGCRLYPLDQVSRIGAYSIFNFHIIQDSVICPFKVHPHSETGISYASVLEDIGEWNEQHPAWSQAVECRWLAAEADLLIGNETQIRDSLAKTAPESSLLEVLALGSEKTVERITEQFDHLAQAFGFDLQIMDGTTVEQAALFSAFIPSLRIQYLSSRKRQSYARSREHLSSFLCLSYLFSESAARASGRELSADLVLRVTAKLGELFHLGALLEQVVCLPSFETLPKIAFPVETPEALALVHLLRQQNKLKLWEIINEAIGQGNCTPQSAATYLGALIPLAPHLVETEFAQ